VRLRIPFFSRRSAADPSSFSRVEEERNRVHADIQQMLAERDQVRQRCTQLENERKQAEVSLCAPRKRLADSS
jgi:hypothetical protein